MQAATEMLKEQNDETLNALLEMIYLKASSINKMLFTLISLLSAAVYSSIPHKTYSKLINLF